MAPKRVLILGASRYYARSIQSARQLGYIVVASDRNPNAEGFRYADHSAVADITDIDASLEVARRYQVDGVVPVNDFGVQAAAAISEELGLVGIGRAAAAAATSKRLMRERWDAAGVGGVRWRAAASIEEAERAADDMAVWPLVVKPQDSRGGGSRGVSIVHRPQDLRAALVFARDAYDDDAVILEEFLEGVEHSVETLTYQGVTHVLAVSDKVKTPQPYRVDKSVIYPSQFEGADLERIEAACRRAVAALGIAVGPAHVEVCSTPTGPRPFDLGARCGGGGTPDPIVPFITGIQMFQEVVRIAVGDQPARLDRTERRGCVYRFLTPPPGLLREVEGLDLVAGWAGVLDAAVTVMPGERIRSVRTGADRAGFVIAGGDTRSQALALADQAEERIRFLYA